MQTDRHRQTEMSHNSMAATTPANWTRSVEYREIQLWELRYEVCHCWRFPGGQVTAIPPRDSAPWSPYRRRPEAHHPRDDKIPSQGSSNYWPVARLAAGRGPWAVATAAAWNDADKTSSWSPVEEYSSEKKLRNSIRVFCYCYCRSK